jgi:predicted RNase H-like nuclease
MDPPQETPSPECWDRGLGSQNPTGYEVGRERILSHKSEFPATGICKLTFPPSYEVFDTFANLVGWLQPDSIIAVDMPIGLPERAIKGGRAPDWAAKEFLGPRRASVFLVPSRRAVYAREAVDAYKQGYRRVCAVACETSDPRRAPSIQAYSIFPRIQQIDQMLRQDKALRRRVFEVHPEVSLP